MRAVVADTGPLHYLVLIGEIDLLPGLFDIVSVPGIVLVELSHLRAPEMVRDWISSRPSWLRIVATPPVETLPLPTLDDGERAAIALAESLRADLVLMDDREGVASAVARGLAVVGTLGVLDRAARLGLVDLAQALTHLKATNFRVRPEMLDAMLDRHRRGERGL